MKHEQPHGDSRNAEGPPARTAASPGPVKEVDSGEIEPSEGVVHAFTEQEIAEHSPEGLPPDEQVFRVSTGLLTVVAAVAIAGLVVGSIWLGWMGLVAAGVLLFIYFLSAWPAWSAGLLRHRERAEAARQVREDLVRERLESADAEPPKSSGRRPGTMHAAGR